MRQALRAIIAVLALSALGGILGAAEPRDQLTTPRDSLAAPRTSATESVRRVPRPPKSFSAAGEPLFRLAAARQTPAEPPRPAEAVEVFHCDFGEFWDKNYDQWPDDWTRFTSPRYPHYLPVQIAAITASAEDEAPQPNAVLPPKNALRIQLDGGGALIHSPPIPIDPQFTYLLEARIRTDNLLRSGAFITLNYYDAKRQPLKSYSSTMLSETDDWQLVRISTGLPPPPQTASAEVSLHVEPREKLGDLRGSAEFSEIWIGRLPRITLTANRKDQIYLDPERPEITCQASGLHDPAARIVFELLDRHDRPLIEPVELGLLSDSLSSTVQSRPRSILANPDTRAGKTAATATSEQSRDPAGKQSGPAATTFKPAAGHENQHQVYSGKATWRPPIHQPGYYRIRVKLPGELGSITQRDLTVVVMKPLPTIPAGEFGWTLSDGEGPLSFSELADLAGNSGIHWLKIPVWSAAADKTREDQLLWFAENLGMKRIEMVGILADPPEAVMSTISGGDSGRAAGLFSAPTQVWYPSLEPIIGRLSARVRHWQLGRDDDQSFIGFAETAARIETIRKLFSRFGQRMQFGIGWNWLRELPTENPGWDFSVLSTRPQLTANELRTCMQAGAGGAAKRWVVLEPLPQGEYSLDARCADLAQQMTVAKAGGAEAIFAARLFDTRAGLLNDDGTAGPLYIPWRVTAYQLAGSEYLGRLQLPAGVENYVFTRGGESVMVLWSDQPRSLRLSLGLAARIVDLWGGSQTPRREQDELLVEVGPAPIFLTNVHSGLVRFQMTAGIAQPRWASQFGQPQNNAVVLTNSFGQAVSGRVRFTWPANWQMAARELSFKIAPRETVQLPFEVTLPINAGTGRQTITLEVSVDAERPYSFSAEREIDIGLDDIFAEFSTRLTPRGDLEVEQRLTNQTEDAVSFKCYLFAPGRKRIALQVQDHGRGIDVKHYFLPQAADLIGAEINVRAEEVGGARVLNYQLKAEP